MLQLERRSARAVDNRGSVGENHLLWEKERASHSEKMDVGKTRIAVDKMVEVWKLKNNETIDWLKRPFIGNRRVVGSPCMNNVLGWGTKRKFLRQKTTGSLWERSVCYDDR